MKKISLGIAVALLLFVTPLYSQNEKSSQSKKEERKERREERKEVRQNNREEKRQEKDARKSTAPETAGQKNATFESANEDELIEVKTPAPTPAPTPAQRHELRESTRQTEIEPAPQSDNADSEESITEVNSGNSENSESDNLKWWIAGILLGGYMLKTIFSKRCKACGKFWAMRKFAVDHLGTTKKEYVKDSNGGHYEYTNKYNVRRRCKHCGYEDCVEKTTKGK